MRKPTLLLILFSCLSLATAFALYAPEVPKASVMNSVHLTHNESKLLFRGNVVMKEFNTRPENRTHGKTYEARILINSNLDHVYKSLIRFECCDRYMPHVKKSDVIQRKKGEAIVNYTLEVPFGKTKKYRLRMTYSKGKDEAIIQWKMIPWPGLREKDTIGDTQGYWMMRNVASGPDPNSPKQVLLIYHVYADPGKIPAGFEWVVNKFTQKNIPVLMEAVRRRTADSIVATAFRIVYRHSSYKPAYRTERVPEVSYPKNSVTPTTVPDQGVHPAI